MEITKENIQTFAAKIKEAFATFNEKAKFMSAKLADGTQVNVMGDTLAVGAQVTIMTEAGEVPIPDGEYTLEDGTVFYVAGGAVSEVKAPEATGTEEMNTEGKAAPSAPNAAPSPTQIIERIEKEMVFEKVAKVDELEKTVADLVTKFAAVEKENADLKKELESEKAKFSSSVKAMNEALEAFGEQPQVEAPKPSKDNAEKKESIEEFRKRVFKV